MSQPTVAALLGAGRVLGLRLGHGGEVLAGGETAADGEGLLLGVHEYVADACGGEVVGVGVVEGPGRLVGGLQLVDGHRQHVKLGLPAHEVVLVGLREGDEHLLAPEPVDDRSAGGGQVVVVDAEVPALQLGADHCEVDLPGQGYGSEGGVERALTGATACCWDSTCFRKASLAAMDRSSPTSESSLMVWSLTLAA